MIINALIVTYNPETECLIRTFDSLKKQVSEIVIVDNGSKNLTEIEKLKPENSVLIPLNDNFGNSYASNRGFEYLQKNGSDFVILSDQDTIYSDNYVEKFKEVFFQRNDAKIAVYAPFAFDNISKEFLPVGILVNNRIKEIVPQEDCFVFRTIASGMIINCKLFPEIGGWNELVFVDVFDYEWCWKVNYKGYKIFVSSDLKISHKFGDKITYLLGKRIILRSDIRYYYIIKNHIYLSLTTKYLSRKGRFFIFIFAMKCFAGFLFFAKNKALMFRAVIDGLRLKTGKLVLN